MVAWRRRKCRDAAGEMVESVAKSVRRKKEVNEEFLQKLFEEMTALHHLDETGSQNLSGGDLGPLPPTAVALLTALGATWVILGSAFLYGKLKKKKQ